MLQCAPVSALVPFTPTYTVWPAASTVVSHICLNLHQWYDLSGSSSVLIVAMALFKIIISMEL